MKLLTLNFLTCAIKTCKPLPSAFPLHVQDAELEAVELDFNPLFLRNVLSRIEWPAMRTVLSEVGLKLPDGIPGAEEDAAATTDAGVGSAAPMEGVEAGSVAAEGGSMQGLQKVEIPDVKHEEEIASDATLKKLHELLMETQITTGKLVCGNCGHEYAVREGIPNFLLPPHLV